MSRYNLNRGKEERDNWEAFVRAMLAMELITAEAHYKTQLDFARMENWTKAATDELEWKLEVIRSEINVRFK